MGENSLSGTDGVTPPPHLLNILIASEFFPLSSPSVNCPLLYIQYQMNKGNFIWFSAEATTP